MAQAVRTGRALRQVTLAALWRRRTASILLALAAALSVAASCLLHGLTARQEAAIEEMIDSTNIQCIVTNAQGTGTGNLQMVHGFVSMLVGQRHEQDCWLDQYVKNVRAKSSEKLKTPQGMELRRILSFDSDSALSASEGASVRMEEGWTEEALRSSGRICLIPEGMETETNEAGRETVYVSMEDGVGVELQVAGRVSGGPGNVIWCPFFMARRDGISELIWVESCSFDIGDNRRLEECRDAIYDVFVEPDPANFCDIYTQGVLVQDEAYLSTLEEFQSNLAMLRLLLPVLVVLCGGIGFLAGFLTARGRIREFAVMRCLGVKRRRIFSLVLWEHVLLTAAGALAGLLTLPLAGELSGGLLLRTALLLAAYLAGAAAAVGGITRVNVMKLLREEE